MSESSMAAVDRWLLAVGGFTIAVVALAGLMMFR